MRLLLGLAIVCGMAVITPVPLSAQAPLIEHARTGAAVPLHVAEMQAVKAERSRRFRPTGTLIGAAVGVAAAGWVNLAVGEAGEPFFNGRMLTGALIGASVGALVDLAVAYRCR